MCWSEGYKAGSEIQGKETGVQKGNLWPAHARRRVRLFNDKFNAQFYSSLNLRALVHSIYGSVVDPVETQIGDESGAYKWDGIHGIGWV